MLWRSQAYNAFKHLLVFCPLETKILTKLSIAQETWARALLGWEPSLPGIAAVNDMGWMHITFEVIKERCALYTRLQKCTPARAIRRTLEIMDAASNVETCWTHQMKIYAQ